MTEYCRAIRTNGARCRAFAVTGDPHCYWHGHLHRRHRRLDPAATPLPDSIPENHRNLALLQSDPLMAKFYGVHDQLHGPLELRLPALEDRESIQLALSLLLSALAANRIDGKRATTLLYGLQVASANARSLDLMPLKHDQVTATVVTPDGLELALDEDPEVNPLAALFDGEDADDEEDEDDEASDDEEAEDEA